MGRGGKCIRQRKEHVQRPCDKNREVSKFGTLEKGENKGRYHVGLADHRGTLSFILKAIGVHERAPNPTGKMQTHSAN